MHGAGKPTLLLRASLGRCTAPSCNTENFDGPEEAVCSYGQIFLMALHRADGYSSHTGRFKQEKLNHGTFPACIEQNGVGWPLQIHRLCCSPLHLQLSATSGPTPLSSPGCCRRFLGTWPEGKVSVILSFPDALRCGFAGSRDEEALADAQQPVQALPGAVDEDSQRVPALFCPLHQAQWVQEAHGKSCFSLLVAFCMGLPMESFCSGATGKTPWGISGVRIVPACLENQPTACCASKRWLAKSVTCFAVQQHPRIFCRG